LKNATVKSYEKANAKKVVGLPSYFGGFRRVLGTKSVNVKFGQTDAGDIVEGEQSRFDFNSCAERKIAP
jgi:hypothetical protein